MAIFAKKHGAKQGETKVDAEIVRPAVSDSAVTTLSVVGSGVAEPAAVEQMDIDLEVIEPEAIELVSESAGTPAFGIADAIRLMRSLPSDSNIDLVVRVVRVTLGAVNVSVEDIMQDAARKETVIQDDIAALQTQADDLEKQLYAKRCEIAAHETDLKETVTVRERLHMADQYSGHRPPPTPSDAAKHNHVKPSAWAVGRERSEAVRG